jgi:hypothetical protein
MMLVSNAGAPAVDFNFLSLSPDSPPFPSPLDRDANTGNQNLVVGCWMVPRLYTFVADSSTVFGNDTITTAPCFQRVGKDVPRGTSVIA